MIHYQTPLSTLPRPTKTISQLPKRIQDLIRCFNQAPRHPYPRIENAGSRKSDAWFQVFQQASCPMIVKGYLQGTDLDGVNFEDLRTRAGHHVLDPNQKPMLMARSYGSWLEEDEPMTLSDYLDRVVLNPAPVDEVWYVRYRNLRIGESFRQALGLIQPPFLNRDEINFPCIWFGRRGHFSKLHTDPYDNFVLCVIGKKRFYLFPPDEIAHLYMQPLNNTSFLTSPIDPRNASTQTYPSYRPETVITVDIEPGDLLYVPFGWPHFVVCEQNNFMYNYWRSTHLPPLFLLGKQAS
ncbi:MAG: cupin-like domain-containing protein [Magnetococcales bacterium]|nr:cupin-like domain-containing protein [Magnetococcales bacterium]